MSINSAVSKQSVIDAVRQEIDRMPSDVREAFRLSVVDERVESSDGDWIVPVVCGASDALRKSFELHRALSDLQRSVEDRTGVYVTIILDH